MEARSGDRAALPGCRGRADHAARLAWAITWWRGRPAYPGADPELPNASPVIRQAQRIPRPGRVRVITKLLSHALRAAPAAKRADGRGHRLPDLPGGGFL